MIFPQIPCLNSPLSNLFPTWKTYPRLTVGVSSSGKPRVLIHQKKNSYIIRNSFEVEDNRPSIIYDTVKEFDYTNVQDYLDPVIRLMRLTKQGNICMPLKYYYFQDDNEKPVSCGWGGNVNSVIKEPFTLDRSEIPALERFIRDNTLPLAYPSLQMALDNFELSYQTPLKNLAFSLLLNSLVCIFHPRDNDNVLPRVSRNIAVLLGENKEKARNIHRDVESLFKKQSEIARSGDPRIVKKLDVLKCRVYVRESIKKILRMDLDKNELLKLLSTRGYRKRSR